MKIDFSDVRLDYKFLADLQGDLEDAAVDYGLELRGVEEDDDADDIVAKANRNTKALEKFQAASERLDQAFRVLLRQQDN